MPTARCSMSTARLPDERSRIIEAGKVGADVVGADLTAVGAAEAGHQVQGLLLVGTGIVVQAADTVGMPEAVAPPDLDREVALPHQEPRRRAGPRQGGRQRRQPPRAQP